MNLGCHCKILGCHFDTQKRLKKHCTSLRNPLGQTSFITGI